MNFEDFLLLEGKLYAYSKDGVRKQVRDTDEATHWRNTVAKPVKEKSSAVKVDHLPQIARFVQDEVSNHWPDSDGWDAIYAKIRNIKPGIEPYDATMLMDKAVKAHLQAKNFSDFVEHFGDDLPK